MGAWCRSRSGSTPDRAGDTPLDAEFHAGFIFCIYLIVRGRLTDLLAVECFLAVGPLFCGMCAIGRARARTLASHGGGGATGSAPFALLTAVVSGRALAAGFSAQLVFLEVMQFSAERCGPGVASRGRWSSLCGPGGTGLRADEFSVVVAVATRREVTSGAFHGFGGDGCGRRWPWYFS